MIETLMGYLSQAVSGAPLAALAAAVGWGVLSIVLSPCHLAILAHRLGRAVYFMLKNQVPFEQERFLRLGS